MRKTKKAIIATLAAATLTMSALGLAACSKSGEETPPTPDGGGATHTVTFKVNGGAWNTEGTEVADKTITTDEAGKIAQANFPSNPVKADNTFGGWYANAEGTGTSYTFASTFAADMELYAKWTPNGVVPPVTDTTWTVTFNANGGTVDPASAKTGTDGKLTLTELPTPTKADNTFGGWYTDATAGEKVELTKTYDADTTIYAHWTPNGGGTITPQPVTYTITLDANGGVLTGATTVTTGTDGKLATMPADPTRTNYEFDGWYKVIPGGEERVTKDTVFEKDYTIVAHWAPVQAELEEGDYNLYVNGKLVDNALLPGTDGAPTKPADLVFNYYAKEKIALKKGDTVKFVLKDITIDKIWAKPGTAIVGVKGTEDSQGANITGDTVTVLADGTYDVSVSRYEGNQVTENEVSVYIGPYTGSYDDQGGDETTKTSGLYLGDVRKGEFGTPDETNKEVWARDIDFKAAGAELEIWYDGAQVTNIKNDDYSTPKVVLTADHKLKLAAGADISNSIINVLYMYGSNMVYVQEVVRADIQANDGVYIGTSKKGAITQNVAGTEVMATGITVPEGGTKELTIKLGGAAVEIVNFGKDEKVKATLGADKKTITIAAGTYSFYYNYSTAEGENKQKLWIAGTSTGELPSGGGTGGGDQQVVEDGAYLLGTVNEWKPVTANKGVGPTELKEEDGVTVYGHQYHFTVTFAANAEFKIATFNNNEIDVWYAHLGSDVKESVATGGGTGENPANIKVVEAGDYDVYLKIYTSGSTPDIWLGKKTSTNPGGGGSDTGDETPLAAGQYIKIGEKYTKLTAGTPNKEQNETEYYNVKFKLEADTDISLWTQTATAGSARAINQVKINGVEKVNDSTGKSTYKLEAGDYNVHYKVYTNWVCLDIQKASELGDDAVTISAADAGKCATITIGTQTVKLYIKVGDSIVDAAAGGYYIYTWGGVSTGTDWPGSKITKTMTLTGGLSSQFGFNINKGGDTTKTGDLGGITTGGVYVITYAVGGGSVAKGVVQS